MKQAQENLIRQRIFGLLEPVMEENLGEVIRVAKNKVMIPVVDDEGNEGFASVTVSIERTKRAQTAEEADPYEKARIFALDQQEKEEAKRLREEEAAKKEAARAAKVKTHKVFAQGKADEEEEQTDE